MFPNNIEFFGCELDKERLADAKHIRLVKIAAGQQSNSWETLGKIARWLGSQMIARGEQLRDTDPAPVSEVA